jgi:hypothetical protein
MLGSQLCMKIEAVAALRSDMTPSQKTEALQIGRIGFASAGARPKLKAA